MSSLSKKGSTALLLAFLGFLLGAYATSAAPVLNLSGGSSSFSLAGASGQVDPDLTIVDPTSGTITAANVRISSGFENGDVLTLPSGAGYSGITGTYDPGKGILSLSGSGTAAQYQAALRAVVFSTTNLATTRRSIDITLGSAIAFNGHFYEIVNSPAAWPVARAAATNRILFGVAGYLANITSQEENNFIQRAFGQDAWMGASDADAEGVWKWMDGPEAGTTFWNGGPGGSAPADKYANWGVGQPSNDGNIENYGAFNGSSGGKWNDYEGSGPYIVEYGNPGASISFSGTKVLIASPVLSSVDGATINLNFQASDTTAPLSYANGWSSNDQTFRPDGYADDSLNAGNTLGYVGGFANAPANATTQLTYNFTPGNSNRYVFQWNQNITSSSNTYPGDDVFGWRFLSGANTAFSIRFLNDSSTGRDLLVQGYDGAGNALTLGSGQPNDWFIDRDDANDFRVTADLENKKWALDVFNKANSTWFGLVANANIDPTLSSLDGIAATWTVADTTFDQDAGQYLGAGDNFMSFDDLTIQGKQTVVIALNLPGSNPTYNGLPKTITPTTTPSGVAVVVKYNGSTNAPVNAGTYTVTAEVVDTTTYYSAPTSGSLTVEKATQIISGVIPSEVMIFGDPPYNLGASTDSPLGLTYVSDNPAVATVDSNGEVTIVGGGFATITVSQAGNSNYLPAEESHELTVNRAAQAISGVAATAEPKTYGDPSYNLGASTDSPLGLTYVSDNPAVATVDASGEVTIVGAGVATITVSQGGDGNYEPATDVTHVLTVNKADQTISGVAATETKTYGDLPYNLFASTDSSLPLDFYSDNPNVATVDANGEVTIVGAGVATITVSQMGGDNHFPADVTHVLTVNKAAQTISGVAATETKTYGDLSYNLGASTSSSLLLTYTSDTPTVATVDAAGEVTIVGAGVVTITVSQSGGDNYEPATDVTHVLTVNKATQTISGVAATETKTYGDLPYSLGASVDSLLFLSYSSDNSAVATVDASGEVTILGAGSVTITVSQIGDDNHEPAADVSHVLTVNKATQTITGVAATLTKTVGDAPYSLSAVADSMLIPTFSSSNTGVATVDEFGQVTIVGAGTTTITVSQAGDNNYNAATPVTQVLTVNSADTPWDIWADSYSMANGTERTKTADPDGDGFNNATEFAFGTDPLTRTAEIFSAASDGSDYVVTFKKRKLASEATYEFRSSTDLTQAFVAGTLLSLGTATSVDANYEQVSVTLPLSGDRGFIRGQANVLVNPSR